MRICLQDVPKLVGANEIHLNCNNACAGELKLPIWTEKGVRAQLCWMKR